MTNEKDVYWDELGVAWQAISPDEGLLSSRLAQTLRRQHVLAAAGAILALTLGLVGLALAGWCAWIAWSGAAWNFAARGAALAVAAVLSLVAAAALRTGSASDVLPVHDRLVQAARRAERLVRAAGLGCLALGVLAAGGLAGYVVRARLGRPPAMSPLEDLLILAMVGLVLAWIGTAQAHALGRYRHLSGALAEDQAAEAS